MNDFRARIGAAVLFPALVTGLLRRHPAGLVFCPSAESRSAERVRGCGGRQSVPVAGATVFLKNQKTKAIRSYTSAKDGRFHFAQVNMADDYDLWAEKDGRKTGIKTVSSWDARKEFETELRMK